MTPRFNSGFYSKFLSLTVCISLLGFAAPAFALGTTVDPAAPVTDKLDTLETAVYGKTYSDQDVSQRLNRLERSLFGNRRAGSLENRLLDVQAHQNRLLQKEDVNDTKTVVSYLEKKLFQQEFTEDPLPERLNQLETHVFGKTFEAYPEELRTKKLMYTVPILAKSVRLSGDGGIVVASTAKQTEDHTRTRNKELDLQTAVHMSTAGKVSTIHSQTVSGDSVSLGNYYHNVHQHQPGKVLRWGVLPVQVFIKNASAPQYQITTQVINHWNRYFQFALVNRETDADIIIDWQAGNTQTTITPVRKVFKDNLHNGMQLRTVVLFNASPFAGLSPSECHHSLAHGLGHASGIWGHSHNPNDIMYPLLKWENNDIPNAWLRRSGNMTSLRDTRTMLKPDEVPQITQRDISTLTKIYNNEGLSLKVYNP